MERHCQQCGASFHGRIDKKFCSDECRADYHNGRRREREKELRQVNRILSSNWRILMQQLRLGRSEVPATELAAQNFNFNIYTATQRRFPGRRTYWCYNCTYRISQKGIVHISLGDCRNNAYL
jgi:predicted nucleic acid-binding Zn ribbon protein